MSERKKLIKPITIVKVMKFLKEVISLIERGGSFSIDKLTREHSLGTSTGKAMVELGMISKDLGGVYSFGETEFIVDRKTAISIIEKVRVMNIEMKENKSFITNTTPSNPNFAMQHDPGLKKDQEESNDVNLNKKALKTPEIAIVLEKIFSKMNEGKQSDIFDGISNVHNERIHVASAISSGIWASLGLGQDFHRMSDGHIREVNEKIVFTANDLIEQVLNFKK